jgi:superfamily II DNA or RNA helicase
VIILNTDPNLLFRDFKRLKGLLTDINKAIADSLTAEYF